MILAGLWHGSTMGLFLKPLAQSLKVLATEGMATQDPSIILYIQLLFVLGVELSLSNTTAVQCKAFLLCCTCDLPAKAAVLNFVQLNGFYGCSQCLQKGNF